MENELLKIKLKKTQIEKDHSKPNLKPEIDENGVSEYQNSVLDFNIEKWIDLIRDYTFETAFLPLTLEDADMFERAYELFEQQKPLPEDLKERKNQLKDKLQALMDKVRGTDNHVFVKTSCRSAKDTPIYNQNFRSLYRKFLSSKTSKDENDKIISLLEAGTELLKFKNAEDILDNFCQSERIFQDMRLAKEHLSRFEQHFVVRKWIDIDVDMEFRGFVSNGKLNALSQYNHLAFFPRLLEMKDSIAQRIVTFWEEKIKSKLEKNFSKYIIDFALCGPNCSTVLIIELNPFLPSTDSALFSWQNEKHILENGPFEFRVRDRKAKGAKSLLSLGWREILQEETI